MASRISVPSSFAALRRRPAAVGAAGFFLLLSLGLLASSGCTLSVAGIDDGSGGTSTTASTGTGGTECIDGSECSDGNPCTDDVCTKGKCDNPANDKIVPTDPNPCTKDECKNGVQSHTNEPAGKPCGTDLKCDAGGVCQCTANEQCGAPTSCVKPTCDLVKGCVIAADCQSDVCEGQPKVCKSATCNDGRRNGTETDGDCGGKCADGGQRCSPGQKCKAPNDCTSHVCQAGFCQQALCTDGVKNGNELGVDCGGDCGPCPPPN